MSDGGIDRLTVGQTNNNITVCCVWSYQKKRAVCGSVAGGSQLTDRLVISNKRGANERTKEGEKHVLGHEILLNPSGTAFAV
ncbi:hypothetical protein TNCV_3057761 [Trichonephila clavipes]|nr:hypothetical protein TNCV_3057761 [Trichonephila clavipes]